MSFIRRLLGMKPARPHSRPAQPVAPLSQSPASQFPASQNSRNATVTPYGVRKELLRLVLREALTQNGIPLDWIGADALAATSRGRDPGIHVRLMLRNWDPRVMVHGPAFQQDLEQRLLAMDPLAAGWLMGISWQFDLPDYGGCPALPHPATWTALPTPPVDMLAEPAPLQPAGDVISGPVIISPTGTAGRASSAVSDARADLELLMAARDADMQRHAEQRGATFAPTEPSPL